MYILYTVLFFVKFYLDDDISKDMPSTSSRLFKALKGDADQHTERSRNRESLLSSN